MAANATAMAASAALTSPLVAAVGKKDFSSSSSFRTTKSFAKQGPARIVCSASTPSEEGDSRQQAGKWATALALAAIASSTSLALPREAMADVAGLTPCAESKQFAKRQAQEVKKLNSRLKKYEAGSAPALALEATINRTNTRFEKYASQGLLCGTDGYPHLIVDGDQKHLGEFVKPGIVFLYIAGWIGWVGREYLIAVRKDSKPTQKEIIIDVPLATKILLRGFTWPVAAVSELRNGKLIEDASNITVSPR
eukprot:TRINITY_DN68_c0_g1_i3.p1 TRINITY_DN68_c0_g1~~TRINITY_DN68_c0_g1_i3.p1  ORF type:complete len:252 (-),score=57.09 TRINITY_DN68_c0_g1_i3:247-1002(-)